MKVLVLIGGHLCTAPRPFKEACALARAGAVVHVRGVDMDQSLRSLDQKLWQSHEQSDSGRFNFSYHPRVGWWNRVRRGMARRLPPLRLPERFGLCPLEMLRTARDLRPDLVIAHSEASLWAANRLADEGFNVGVDLEDWFSEDLLPSARTERPVEELNELEGALLRRGTYRLTTSAVLAAALGQRHNVLPPTVVRNVFPLGSEPEIAVHSPVRLHWFSQTIGPGRGLELVFAALPHVTARVEIHLRGTLPGRYRGWLEGQVPPTWRDRLHLHETVPNGELHSAIGQHDIGLALETQGIPSRNLTITNKFFQYLNAGLAVIATATDGQREALAEAPDCGVLIPEDPMQLAAAINELAGDPARLLAMRRGAREAARERLCWEHEEPRLLAEFERAQKG